MTPLILISGFTMYNFLTICNNLSSLQHESVPCGCKTSPYFIVVQIILSGPLGSLSQFYFLLKLVLEDVGGIAFYIAAHEQTQSIIACVSFFKGSLYQNLFIFLSLKQQEIYVNKFIPTLD